MPLDDVAIISKYNSEIRGLYNYYRLAINVCNLGKFHSIMRCSCLKTLAAKYNSSVMKMYKKYSEVYVLTASFNSVSGLRPGAEVEIAGVRVGRVKSIRLDDKQPRAVVELQLGDNVHLTDDVIASVKTSGLIGDKYISLEPGGSGEPLKNGDEITDTESAVDIESLISKYVFGKV